MIDFDTVQKEEVRIPVYTKVQNVDLYWMKQSRDNFADYFFYMTGQRMADHHIDWAYSVLAEDSSKTNIIAPRGSGKTTLLNMLISWYKGKKPYTSSAIICASHEQAKERLQDVKSIMESQKYKNVFPEIQIDDNRPNTSGDFSVWSLRWKDEKEIINYRQWRDRVRSNKDLSAKDSSLRAAGLSSKAIPGKRFTGLVVADDLHDEQNSATEEQRIKVETLFKKTLIGCMTPKARIVLICTRWAETDLSGRLMADKKRDGTPIWKTIEVKAINADGTSYWPEIWPIDLLEERRELIGEVMFQLMYMNNPLGMSSGEITIDMLRNAIDWDRIHDKDFHFDEIVISTDVAESLTLAADYSVFNVQGKRKIVDPKKKYPLFEIYILKIWRGRVKQDDFTTELADLYQEVIDEYGWCDAVLFEKQGMQGAWVDDLKSKNPAINVIEVQTKGNKEERFKSPAARIQQGKYYFNVKMKNYEAMCSELIAFPSGPHDDIVDSFSLPYSYWGITTGRGAGRKVVKSNLLH